MRRPRMSPAAALVAGLALAGAAGCSDPSGPPEEIAQLPRPLSLAEQSVLQASNQFAFGLLREVHAREDVAANVVVSPLQKTFLSVDEAGTEAAAVTPVEGGATSLPPGIRLNRPFLLAIRERHSGAILFIGAIGDPR